MGTFSGPISAFCGADRDQLHRTPPATAEEQKLPRKGPIGAFRLKVGRFGLCFRALHLEDAVSRCFVCLNLGDTQTPQICHTFVLSMPVSGSFLSPKCLFSTHARDCQIVPFLPPHQAPHGKWGFLTRNTLFLWELQGATRLGATGLRGSEREICLWGSLRGSLRGRVSDVFRGFQRFSDVFRGFQRFLEVFRGFQRFLEVFRGF